MMDINFHNVNLKNAILKQAHLIDSQFTDNVKLNGTDFTDAFLNNADFSGSRLENANFSGATLSGVNFNNTVILESQFENCITNSTTTVQNSDLTLDIEQLSFLAKKQVDMSDSKQNAIVWSYVGKPTGYEHCTQWYETLSTCTDCDWDQEHGHIGGKEDACCNDSKYWPDNYLCSRDDIGLYFNNAGGHHENYVKLAESSDNSWEDNYLSFDNSKHPINLYWQSYGKVDKKLCVNTDEPLDESHTWQDNYLCFDFD
jgi:hypothetical protein